MSKSIPTAPHRSDIEEVTEGLMEAFRGLRDGTLMPEDVAEQQRIGSTVIAAYKARLAYHALRGEKPFLVGLEGADVPDRRLPALKAP